MSRVIEEAEHAPTLSVIVACYNGETYLEQALASIIPQLGPGDEIVIQDGGSDDRTVEILAAHGRQDSRIKWRTEADTGQSDALNRALERATNPYVLWMNA